MTADRTAPVLDVDRLDAAADAALAGVRLDLAAVRARAGSARRDRVRRWGLVAAAAAAVLLVTSVAGGGVGALRGAPQPAATPSGPGALPERVYPLPRVVPSVTDRPVARVALVLAGEVTDLRWGRPSTFTGPVLVSADGGEYRRLPGGGVGALSVGDDGRIVAWAGVRRDDGAAESGIRYEAVVRWVDVSTGRVDSVALTGAPDEQVGVGWTSVSPDGSAILVGTDRTSASGAAAIEGQVWQVDVGRRAVRLLCVCSTEDVAWDGAGRRLGPGADPLPVTAHETKPPEKTFGAARTELVASPRSFVSRDGARQLLLDANNATSAGEPDDLRLVEVDRQGAVARTVPLGRLPGATLLAWADDRAWVRVDDVTRASATGSRVVEVDLNTGAQAPALVAAQQGRGRAPVVDLVVGSVAAGSRVAATPAPASPWWSPVVAVLDVVLRPEFLTVVGFVLVSSLLSFVVRVVRRRAMDEEPVP